MRRFPFAGNTLRRTQARILVSAVLGGWFLFHAFTAQGNIPKSSNEEIPPLKPPLGDIPPEVWEEHGTAMITGGVLALAAIGAAVWLAFRPRPVDPIPPEMQARRDLENLKGQAQTGQLLSSVSRVTRSYLSRAFQLPMAELTTMEFCEQLAKAERVGPVLGATAQKFLKHCDELKFAPAPPPGPFDAVAESLSLVEQGQARLVEARRIELENAAEMARKASG
jgi:hypothetical protein